MDENIRVIEINGIKMEVDLRTVKQINSYKVGDKVRVLIKGYSDWKTYSGIIVGFDNFVNRPTIVVAYIDYDKLSFTYLNNDSKDVEIAPLVDNHITLEKSSVLNTMNREITKKEAEVEDLKAKKEYFIKYFDSYFTEVAV